MDVDVRDGVVRRVAWRTAHVVGRVLGPGAARRTARMIGALEGLTDSGVHRVALRISPRVPDQNPELVKIPPEWAVPSVVVRRFLRGELRQGDVVLDIGCQHRAACAHSGQATG